MELQIDGVAQRGRVIFAHGAGAGKDHPNMERLTECFLACGLKVIRFEFPYMQQRKLSGTKRPPDKMDKLEACYRQIIEQYAEEAPLILAGKSMGGRVATHLVDQSVAHACIAIGYPFHPSGKPEKRRTEHLGALEKPLLIVQGTRDKLGSKEEVGNYELSDSIKLCWLEDGDHDLKPRVRSGFTHEAHFLATQHAIDDFLRVNFE